MDMKLFILFFIGCFSGIAAKSVHSNNQMKYDDKSTELNISEVICKEENKQTPHEKKCNLYYRCVYGKKICKECPNGKMFNPQISNCDSSYNVACGLLETEEENETLYGDFSEYHMTEDKKLSEALEYLEKTAQQSSECPEKQDPYEPNPLLPHEDRCNAFYKCSNGQKYLMKCPGMLQFNPRVLACDLPKNVRCIDKRIFSSTDGSTVSSSTLAESSEIPTKKFDGIERTTKKSSDLNIQTKESEELSYKNSDTLDKNIEKSDNLVDTNVTSEDAEENIVKNNISESKESIAFFEQFLKILSAF